MNIATSPHTLRELKRQLGFHRTMYKQHEAKHQAAQAAKMETIQKLETQIAIAAELEEMEVN